MYSIDTAKARMEAVEIFEIPGLFITSRIDHDTIPKGMYAYDLQASKDNWNQPCRIACQITKGHFGTVLTASPIVLSESGCCEMSPSDFTRGTEAERLTVTEFEAKYLSPCHRHIVPISSENAILSASPPDRRLYDG